MRKLARVLRAFALVEGFARKFAMQVHTGQPFLAVAMLVELAHLRPSVRVRGIVAVGTVVTVAAVAFSEELADRALRPPRSHGTSSSDGRRVKAASFEPVIGRRRTTPSANGVEIK